MPAPPIHIERLRLDIPGTSADHGKQVAALVAAELANVSGLPASGDLATLRITITADPRTEPASLARRIAAAIARDLARPD